MIIIILIIILIILITSLSFYSASYNWALQNHTDKWKV